MLWCWSVAALAQGALGVDEAQAIVDGLVGQVEALAGRTFVRPPTVAIESRAGLRRRLLAPPIEMVLDAELRRPREAYRPPPDRVSSIDFMVTRALAVYASRDETIFLVKEGFEGVSDQLDLGNDRLRPLLRCVLVHEMVHALQDQYGLELGADDPERRRGLIALREGQADAIASTWCADVEGPAMARLMDTVGGVELAASLSPDDVAALYGWGRTVARALSDEGLAWSALVAGSPPWPLLVAAVEPTHPPRWRDPEPLRAAIRGLDLGDVALKGPEPMSPSELLTAFFEGRWGVDAMPAAEGGFAVEATVAREPRGDVDVLLATFLLEEPGMAADLVERRGAAIRTARRLHRPTMIYAKVSGALLRDPTARPLDVDDPAVQTALRVTTRSTEDGPYAEYWIATERSLVFLAATGRRLGRRQVVDTLLALLEAMPPEPGAPLRLDDLGGWIDEVRAVDPEVSGHPSWLYLYKQAARGVAGGDRRACAEVFGDPLTDEGLPDREPYARAAFLCAAITADLALARRAERHLAELEPWSAVALASRLAESGRAREALAMLAKADVASTGSADLERAAVMVRISAAVRLRDWATAARLVERTPGLDPELRAWVGSSMVIAGRRREGRAILAGTCGELPEGDRRECLRFLRD